MFRGKGLAEPNHGVGLRVWTAETRFRVKRVAEMIQSEGLRPGQRNQGLGLRGWLTRTRVQGLRFRVWAAEPGFRFKELAQQNTG